MPLIARAAWLPALGVMLVDEHLSPLARAEAVRELFREIVGRASQFAITRDEGTPPVVELVPAASIDEEPPTAQLPPAAV